MEIEFKGEHTKEQYFRAIAMLTYPSRTKTILRVAIFVLVLVLYTLYVLTLEGQGEYSPLEITRLFRHLITVLILGYVIFAPYIQTRHTAIRLWQDPLIRKPIPGRLSSQGVSFTKSGNVAVRWDEFLRARKTEDLIVLQTNARHMLVLPRRFFSGEHDWRLANALIDQYVQEPL